MCTQINYIKGQSSQYVPAAVTHTHTQSLEFCPHGALMFFDKTLRTNSDYFPNNIIRLVAETEKQ